MKSLFVSFHQGNVSFIVKLIAQIPKTTTKKKKKKKKTILTTDGNFTSKTGQAFLLKGNFILFFSRP